MSYRAQVLDEDTIPLSPMFGIHGVTFEPTCILDLSLLYRKFILRSFCSSTTNVFLDNNAVLVRSIEVVTC